jgi:hypothetical protein
MHHAAAAAGDVALLCERCDKIVLAFRLPGQSSSSARDRSSRLCCLGSVRWKWND